MQVVIIGCGKISTSVPIWLRETYTSSSGSTWRVKESGADHRQRSAAPAPCEGSVKICGALVGSSLYVTQEPD